MDHLIKVQKAFGNVGHQVVYDGDYPYYCSSSQLSLMVVALQATPYCTCQALSKARLLSRHPKEQQKVDHRGLIDPDLSFLSPYAGPFEHLHPYSTDVLSLAEARLDYQYARTCRPGKRETELAECKVSRHVRFLLDVITDCPPSMYLHSLLQAVNGVFSASSF